MRETVKLYLYLLFAFAFIALFFHCSQPVPPDFQSESFSDVAFLSQVHLKAAIQLKGEMLADDDLPIDVQAKPDSSRHILLKVPKHPTDMTKQTDITQLKPILEGEYFYVSSSAAGIEKFIGVNEIDATHAVTLRVFAENNSFREYTLTVQEEVFPPAPPQAFRLQIKAGALRAFGLLEGGYLFGDANYENEGFSRFRWLRSKLENGKYEPIRGATKKNYRMTQSDAGHFIRFEITPVSSNLSKKEGQPALSAPVGPVRAISEKEILKRKLRIVEIGNKYKNIGTNDYIILYNPSSEIVNLSGLYIGSDAGSSGCSLDSWSNYKALSGTVPANGYFLISRLGNDINADWTQWGSQASSGSITSSYCVVLSISSTQPASAADPQVIDFVGFGNAGISKGENPAPALSDQHILRRKNSCSNRPQDTDKNLNDFERISASGPDFIDNYNVRNSQTNSCGPITTTPPPPTPMIGGLTALLINEWADAGTGVDYIEIRNFGNSDVLVDSNFSIIFGSNTTAALTHYLANGINDPSLKIAIGGGVNITSGEYFLAVDSDVSNANITTIRNYNSFNGKIFLSTESTLIGSNDRLNENSAKLKSGSTEWSQTPNPFTAGTSTYSTLKLNFILGTDMTTDNSKWCNGTAATQRAAGTANSGC